MATESQGQDSNSKEKQQQEEEEFERMVKQIGGRGNIYLVGDADGESNGSVFQEFILDMFHTSVEFISNKPQANGDFRSGECSPESVLHNSPPAQTCPGVHGPHTKGENANVEQQTAGHKVTTVRQSGNTGQKSRSIHCPVIMFIFRHAFIHNKANRVCMEEILRDVKARVKKAHGVHQALLGLVRAEAESSETRDSVVLLQETLRSVFTKHPHDAVWAGHFIPKSPESVENIKRNACRAMQASQSSDHFPSRMRFILWPPRRWFRRGRREQPEPATNTQTQKCEIIQRAERKEFHYRPDPSSSPEARFDNEL